MANGAQYKKNSSTNAHEYCQDPPRLFRSLLARADPVCDQHLPKLHPGASGQHAQQDLGTVIIANVIGVVGMTAIAGFSTGLFTLPDQLQKIGTLRKTDRPARWRW